MTDHHIVTIPQAAPGARAGNAAVHARDDHGVDGHSRPVRDGGDRGLLQHDAAGSEVAGRGDATSS